MSDTRISKLPTMRTTEVLHVAHATCVAMLDIAVTLEVQAPLLAIGHRTPIADAAADLKRFTAKQQKAIEELAGRAATDGSPRRPGTGGEVKESPRRPGETDERHDRKQRSRPARRPRMQRPRLQPRGEPAGSVFAALSRLARW